MSGSPSLIGAVPGRIGLRRGAWLAALVLVFPVGADAAYVELETPPAARGGNTVVIATLRDAGDGVDHAAVAIALPAGMRVRATSLGRPDCFVLCNHDYFAPWRHAPVVVETDGARGKSCYFGAGVGFIPGGCDPLTTCTGVSLIDFDLGRGSPIPDGGDLIQCALEVESTAALDTYQVTCTAEAALGNDDHTSRVECRGAQLTAVCEGDCDHDGAVSIAELVSGIAIALGGAGDLCAAIDRNRDGAVTIAELIRARVNLLNGCDHTLSTRAPTATPTPGPVSFEAPRHVRPGPYPAAFTVADMNNDQAPDLLVALQPDYGIVDVRTFPVALLLGHGDGTFADRETFAVGNTPEGVVAADFDGDGNLDFATGNFNVPFTVSVRLGHGDGTFDAQTQYPAGTRPAAVLAADLDADGALDLVVANVSSRDLSIFYGSGDGRFAPEVRLPSCGGIGLAAGDFTGDGRIDVIASDDGGVCLHRNQRGLLGSAQPVSDIGGGALAVGRLDEDDRLDFAVASADRGEVRVLLNDGDGSFHTAGTHAVEGRPRDVAIGDLDGDERADLVTANYDGRDVAVLVGTGQGDFAPPHYVSVGPYSLPHELAISDINGDGHPDVVTINANTHDASVLLTIAGP